MKKISILILLAIFCKVSYSQEETPNYKNELRYELFQMFKNCIMIGYERTINDKSSVQISAGAILKQTDSEKKNGGLVELQYRLNRKVKNVQAYAGPFLRYRYLDATSTSYFYYTNVMYNNYSYYDSKLYHFSTLSTGVLVGIKFSLFKNIIVDTNFGSGIKFTDTNGYRTSTILDDAYTGVAPFGSISLGYKF